MTSPFYSEKDIEASSWNNGDLDRQPGQPVIIDEIPDEPLQPQNGPTDGTPGNKPSFSLRFLHPFKLFGSFKYVSSRFSTLFSIPSTLLPKDRRKRRTISILIIVTMVAFVALILGLSVGLTRKSWASPVASPKTNAPDGVFTGDMTYYDTGLGACGITSDDGQLVVALGASLFDQYNVGSNPNNNPLCGQTIQVNYNGNSVNLQVVDRCVGCDYDSIDVSPTAFGDLADQSLGRVSVNWQFV